MKKPQQQTKHQLKSEATRAALLQAAGIIFARDGYDSAQIDEIAKSSGRTRGAVYAQYKTKEQLFFAVQEQRMEAGFRDTSDLLAKIPREQTAARLAAVRNYYSEIHDNQTAILDLELKLYALRHPKSADEWRKRYIRTFKRTPGDGFEVGEALNSTIEENRAMALSSIKTGFLLMTFFLPGRFPAAETKAILAEVFDGLFPSFEHRSPTKGTKRKNSKR